MRLTKKKAIAACKKLWREIEESGLSKEEFIGSKVGIKWLGKYDRNCPLCQYTYDFGWNCRSCPLPGENLCRCYNLGFTDEEPPTPEWLAVIKAL